MADVSVKMGVSGISQFKQGMREAQESVKTLDAALKANEKAFKQSGNAEEHMAAQTTLLNQKLKQQQAIVKNAQDALKQMEQNGVKTTSTSYQKMQRQLIEAQSGMMDTQAALDGLGGAAEDAAGKTDKLSDSLGGLNKKVSLDQVISGVEKITGGMEKAAKKAVDLGKEIWNMAMESARYSDDIATQATILGMDPEKYQQYKGVFDTIAEVTVQEWATAKRKIEKAMVDPSKDQIDVLEALGLTGKAAVDGGNGSLEENIKLTADNWEDAFWQIAGELQARLADGRLTEEMADVYGEAIFGKKFSNLKPLIELGRDAFLEALEEQNVASEEAIKKNAELNDKVIKLQNSFKSLEAEVMSGLAPSLTKAAETLDSLLGSVLEYLKTPEGKQALEDLGTAVSGLFDDLGKISPEQVVEGFSKVFGDIVGNIQWLSDNWESVKAGIEGIFGFWATLKVSEGVLTILKVINGLKDLAGIGAAGGSAGVATGLGTALTTGAANVAGFLGSSVLMQNIPVVGDWLTHEGPLGSLLNGTQTTDDMARDFENWQRDVVRNVENFFKDWSHIGDANYDFENHEELKIEPKVEVPKEDIQAQFDAMDPEVKVKVILDWQFGNKSINLPDGTGLAPFHEANGIWSVPFDGFQAVLHKGERVVPAREVGSSRNYSSNLYVESMYMNNGTDAAGLAAAMAAAQRRTMSGYGS